MASQRHSRDQGGSVFLCYSHADKAIAQRLTTMLAESGTQYLLYEKGVQSEEDIKAGLREGIRGCDALVVIVSNASLNSRWVGYEVGYAEALGKPVLPYITRADLEVPANLSGLAFTSVDGVRAKLGDILTTGVSTGEPLPVKPTDSGCVSSPSESAPSSAFSPSPDFFVQSDPSARRSQATWMQRELGLDAAFFGVLLGCGATAFTDWHHGDRLLPEAQAAVLDGLWVLVRHLLSFAGFDVARVRAMVEIAVDPTSSRLAPPWQGESLRTYVARVGEPAIDQAVRWVTGLRFGDPHRLGSTVAAAEGLAAS